MSMHANVYTGEQAYRFAFSLSCLECRTVNVLITLPHPRLAGEQASLLSPVHRHECIHICPHQGHVAPLSYAPCAGHMRMHHCCLPSLPGDFPASVCAPLGQHVRVPPALPTIGFHVAGLLLMCNPWAASYCLFHRKYPHVVPRE